MYGVNRYGLVRYGEIIPNADDIKTLSPDLMRYLPFYYQKSKIMQEIQSVISSEFGLVYYNIRDVEKQFFIGTATWGLDIYEKELGLESNYNLSYQDRREIIKAKWRGFGTVTKEMIKNVAESFSGGEVEVYEYPKEYYFEIKFVGIIGIPPNMQAFKNMIEDIKPAHLDYTFSYRFTTCQMLIDWDARCNEIDKVTCTGLKTYVKQVKKGEL